MTHGLDTSVALRILSGLPEEEAAAVADRLLEDIRNGDEFEVSSLVLSEAYFALQHHYGFSKAEAQESLRALAATPGIALEPGVKAILETPGLDASNPGFVDHMIVAGYAAHGHDTYSCEKAFRRLSGTEILP